MTKLLGSLSVLAAGASLVGMIVGGYLFLDNRYVQAAEQEKRDTKQEAAIEYIQVKQTYREALDDMYQHKDLNKRYPRDSKIKEDFQDAKEIVKDLKEDLKNLNEKRRSIGN